VPAGSHWRATARFVGHDRSVVDVLVVSASDTVQPVTVSQRDDTEIPVVMVVFAVVVRVMTDVVEHSSAFCVVHDSVGSGPYVTLLSNPMLNKKRKVDLDQYLALTI